ncbi:MAG: hypothetical protein IKH10_05105, partial [Bacteroidetes bacterium]|nr:hypothetical protein [Bacteroidota bacterium]
MVKRINLFLLLTIMLLTNVYAGNYKTESNLISKDLKAKLESKLLEAQLGTEYFVIVPPNDPTAGSYMCEVYVGAREPCTVYIDQPNGVGTIDAVQITKPYSIIKKGLPRNWEIRGKDEEPEDLALKIWSDKPIMVYLGSHASATAEGYMALPVNALGTRYVHCSWKSNQESASNDRFHTGFIVGATQSGTKVQVKLRGKNLSAASGCVTDGNAHKIGSTFTLPVMDEWQAINVWDELMEVSNTRGKCDFSGSTITSNKPIAMFSIHERTDIPLTTGNRDNLVEQLLPVNMWGKKHISLQLRCTGATPMPVGNEVLDPDLKVGDYFRVVAAEASTSLNVKWWHTKTGELIKELKNQKLDAEGSFWEWNENISQPRQAGILSVQGVALFESDKPVQVMQYCFSTGYGQSGGNFDPLMVIVPPIEQYGYETIMQTSSYTAMNEHYINIIAEGNASDPIKNEETLGKVTISTNGGNYAKLIEKDESMLKNNVPGTNYYFSGLTVSGATTYAIKSKTKVAATVFGFGSVISYGWPASMALVETSEKDTLFPQIHQVSGCVPTIDNIPVGGAEDRGKQKGKYHFFTYFADTTNYPAPDQFADPQVDLGISYAPRLVIPDDIKDEERELLDNLSVSKYYYFIPAKAPSTNWDSREPIKYGAVEFNVEDIYKDALGFASYTDRAGNETVDTLIYIADKVEWRIDGQEVDMVDFGSKTVGGVYTAIVKLKNVSEKEIHIKELFLSGKEPMYTLTKGTTGLPVTLGPGEEHEIEVTYQPTSGGTAFDVITLYTDCLQFTLNVVGGSGIARIEVSDIDFGRILVGTKTKVNQGGTTVTLSITNNGTEDLRITGYHFDPPQDSVNGPFFYEVQAGAEPTPENPWIIAKNGGTKTGIRQIMFL